MDIREDETSFYILSEDGKSRIAEITFVYTGDNLVIIDHTMVDDSLRGQKVGNKLVAAVVEKMRREQRKIIPLCPFAKSVFDKTVSMTISVTPDNAQCRRGNRFSPHGTDRAVTIRRYWFLHPYRSRG
ncbi:Uncharacterised protein [Morganella morganii]|nr:Uncharacterised protein [Morganella morganii]